MNTLETKENVRQRSEKIVRQKDDFVRSMEMAKIIHAFGGVSRVAQICGCSRQAVYKWHDHISGEPAWQLLAYARRKGMDHVTLRMLRPDLDFGLSKNEIEDV